MTELFETLKTGAEFSPCRTYRYQLSRVWDSSLPRCNFIGLNPSTAGETIDDPTIRRCIGFAKAWGCGALAMTNLFAFRSTDPKGLLGAKDATGPDNDWWLEETADTSTIVIAAWGVHGVLNERNRRVIELLADRLECLGRTKDGHPKHPLYLKADSKREPFRA
jgi:hypothetical protein